MKEIFLISLAVVLGIASFVFTSWLVMLLVNVFARWWHFAPINLWLAMLLVLLLSILGGIIRWGT